MSQDRPVLFRGRHFEDVIILLCVRWYLRYSLSYRDLEEMMAERGLSVDHVTIWRWVQRYAPLLNQRFAENSGIRIGPGVSMRPMPGSPATGPTSTEQWILPATRSISCCRPSGI